MLRAAVIGVGSMGRNHARVYAGLPNVQLVSVADPNEEQLILIKKKYHCKTYQNYEKMLDVEDIDIVSIVVPTGLHKEVALNVIAKGVHTLIEKPIAASTKEAIEIIELAKEKKIKLMIGHIERFNPAIIELKKRLNNDELGKIFKIDIVRVGPFPNRIRDVGVVIDLAVHDLDIIRYLTKSEVKRIYAEIDRKIHSSKEDLVKALVRLENGTICNLSVDWLTPTKIRTISITGEKGMFTADYLSQDLHYYENAIISDRNIEYADLIRNVLEGKMIKFHIHKKEPLALEIQHFVKCVLDNEAPLISGKDGLQALELGYSIIKSARIDN